jgi:1,4-dihydroxy-2-naphthoate octaprenyltransferase
MRKEKLAPWLRIMRLQFYPMSFVAYTLGAAMAGSKGLGFTLNTYLLGYAYLFFLELFAVLSNELWDLPTDRINRNASPYNGGSRVLVEGRLTPEEVQTFLRRALCLLVGSGIWLLFVSDASSRTRVILLLIAGVFMGLGYTVPPLKLCYRGLGELVVGLTHGPYVILCGFVFQSGSWAEPGPWIMSAPLFFAVLAAITLAGVPDQLADKRAFKKTLSVVFGEQTACLLAVVFATLAVVIGTLVWHFRIMEDFGGLLVIMATPHWALLLIAIFLLVKSGNYDRRIDGIMQIALSNILWFGMIPLVTFIRN